MSIVGMDIGYWVAFVAGGLTLIIEANRQFRQPVHLDTVKKYSILEGIDATTFTVRSERLRGHAFYVLCYLFAYVAILSSVKLQEIVLQTASGQAQAGSNFSDEPSEFLFENVNSGLPIFVSAAIISLLSLPAAERVELTIRSVAHYFAGIPGGYHRTMDRLNVALNRRRKDKSRGTLQRILRTNVERAKSADGGEIEPNWDLRADYDDVLGTLKFIDVLQPYVTGESGSRFWPTANTAKLNNLFKRSDTYYSALRDEVARSAQKKVVDDPGYWDHLAKMAVEAQENMRAVFALFCVVSSQTHIPSDGGVSTKIVEEVRELQRGEFFRNVAITCTAFILGVTFLFTFGLTILLQWLQDSGLGVGLAGWNGIYMSGRILFFVCVPALLCIGLREAAQRLQRWEVWDGKGLPSLYQYLRASIIPILFSGVLLVWWPIFFWMFKQVAEGNISSLTKRNIADAFRFSYAGELILVTLVIINCMFIFLVCDRSDGYSANTIEGDQGLSDDDKRSGFRNAIASIFTTYALSMGVLIVITIWCTLPFAFTPRGYSPISFLIREIIFVLFPTLIFCATFAWICWKGKTTWELEESNGSRTVAAVKP